MKKLFIALCLLLTLSTTVSAESLRRNYWHKEGDAIQTNPIGADIGTVTNPVGDIYGGTLYVSGIAMSGNFDVDGYLIVMDTDGDSSLTNDRTAGVGDDEIGITVNSLLAYIFKEATFDLGTATVNAPNIVFQDGDETGDDTLTIALSHDGLGDASFTTSDGSIVLNSTDGMVEVLSADPILRVRDSDGATEYVDLISDGTEVALTFGAGVADFVVNSARLDIDYAFSTDDTLGFLEIDSGTDVLTVDPKSGGYLHLNGATTRLTGTEILNIDSTLDTTTATTDYEAVTNVVTRAAADTGGNIAYSGSVTPGDMANQEWSSVFRGIYDTSAATTVTANAAVFFADISTVDAQVNDYGIYISSGYDLAAFFDGAATVSNGNFNMGTATLDTGDFIMTDGAQAGDDTFTIAMSGDGSGDATFTTTDGDITLSPNGDLLFVAGAAQRFVLTASGQTQTNGALDVNFDTATASAAAVNITGTTTVTSGTFNNLRARGESAAIGASTSDIRGVYAQGISNDSLFGGAVTSLYANSIAKTGSTTKTLRGILIDTETEGTPVDLDNLIGLHIRNKSTIAVDDDNISLLIDNEKMGTGIVQDAGIQLKTTTWGADVTAYTYGIDMNMTGAISTADIRFQNGETISNAVDGYLTIVGNVLNEDTITVDDITVFDVSPTWANMDASGAAHGCSLTSLGMSAVGNTLECFASDITTSASDISGSAYFNYVAWEADRSAGGSAVVFGFATEDGMDYDYATLDSDMNIEVISTIGDGDNIFMQAGNGVGGTAKGGDITFRTGSRVSTGIPGQIIAEDRFSETQGTDVASTTNLLLPTDGNAFEVTGTTKIDLISNIGWQEGSTITLICNESVTIDDGTATASTNITIALAGSGDFGCTAQDILVLKLLSTTADGQAWIEQTRSAN